MARRDFRNARDDQGVPLCPTCGAAIQPGDSTLFADDFMLHVDCWSPPEQGAEDAAEPEPA
jgi:hypothetical protein